MDVHPTTIEDLRATSEELSADVEAVRRAYEDVRREYETRLAALEEELHAVRTTLEQFQRKARSADGAIVQEAPSIRNDLSPPPGEMFRPHITDEPEQAALPITTANGWARALRGKSHYQALVHIAEQSGGTIKVTAARDILMDAGIAKGTSKNVRINVQHLLANSDEFKWSEPGVFRLRSKPERPLPH